MLLRPLITAAGLVSVTQAFLLPPDISAADVEIADALPIEATVIAENRVLALECPGCPSLSNKHHGKPKHHKGHGSHLELDFSVDHSQESDRLMLSGFELYPNANPFNVLVVPQVSDHRKEHKEHNKERKPGDNTRELMSHHKFRPHGGKPKIVEQQLGFSLSSHAVAKSADDALDLVVIDLQIIEVGTIFVDGIPNVRVHLIKTPDSKLMIAKLETTASENVASPMDSQEECTTMLCRWRAIIASQMAKVKQGCHGKMAGMAGHKHESSLHHQMGHDSQGRHHAWGALFKKLTSHILLPVLIGIFAGVSVSILGMIIGTVIVGLYRKFVRGQTFFPTRYRRCHKAPQKEAVLEEEKSGLLTGKQELPPAYTDEEAKDTNVV